MAYGRSVAGLVGALPLADQPTHNLRRQSWDVCPTIGVGGGGTVGVFGCPGCRSDKEHRGARPPLRRVVAHTEARDRLREGQSLGRPGPVLASHLSYPRAPHIAAAG